MSHKSGTSEKEEEEEARTDGVEGKGIDSLFHESHACPSSLFFFSSSQYPTFSAGAKIEEGRRMWRRDPPLFNRGYGKMPREIMCPPPPPRNIALYCAVVEKEEKEEGGRRKMKIVLLKC